MQGLISSERYLDGGGKKLLVSECINSKIARDSMSIGGEIGEKES